MATMTLWLPLVWWLVATATATVTQVPSPEAPPSWLKLLRQFLSLLVPPCPNAGPPGDVGAPILPGPPPATHLQELPGLDAPLKAADAPSPKVPEGAPEELGTVAHGSTAAPTPSSTQEPPGTSAPPCPGDEEPAEVCGTPTAEQRTAVAEALGTFALRFYQRMAEAVQPDANLLFSPLNIAMGLSHLLLGARGETRERLGAILVYPPELGCVQSALQQLASVPGLFSAAQIFHHPGLHLRPRFLNESWHIYGTRPWELSGNESLDLLRINAWVREASRGLLPSLLPTLPPQSRLLLLSAIHLQATWRTPLKAKQTVPLPFLRPGRPPRLVPTMTSKKYPVASFIDPHLQVQVPPISWDPAAWCWGAVASLLWCWGGLTGCDVAPVALRVPGCEVPAVALRTSGCPTGGADGAERGDEPGGAGATGRPGSTGDPGASAGSPCLPGAAAAGSPHTPPGHCPGPAPPAPRPRPGRGGRGPRHGLRAVPGCGAVWAGTGPGGDGGRCSAPRSAGAGRGRCGGGERHGYLSGPHSSGAGGPAPLPLRPLARCQCHPPLHGPPQRPPALTLPACCPPSSHCPPSCSLCSLLPSPPSLVLPSIPPSLSPSLLFLPSLPSPCFLSSVPPFHLTPLFSHLQPPTLPSFPSLLPIPPSSSPSLPISPPLPSPPLPLAPSTPYPGQCGVSCSPPSPPCLSLPTSWGLSPQ